MRPLTQQAKLYLAFMVGAALSGCGAGTKVVSNVTFEDQVNNGELDFAMDATLAPGGLVLPNVTLPLYNPNNPGQQLGQIQTNGLHIILSVNASEALKLPGLADGTKLPNGEPIPLILPTGLQPVGIPVFNSDSQVYLAVNGNQILAGVAVTIAKEDGLNLPISIFPSFTISNDIHGNAGFFLGAKQGVAVFALRENATTTATVAPTLAAASAGSLKSFAVASTASVRPAAANLPKIQTKEEKITNSKMNRLQRTWDGLRHVRID